MHIRSRPHPLGEYLPDIPPMLEQIEAKILSKEPSARYRTADQLGRVLMRFGTIRESTPPQLTLTPEAVNNFEETPPNPAPRLDPVPVAVYEKPSLELDIDWVSIGLGLLALIAVGGLIPFWMWVYYVWNP
jgi:serine/threonine-protein kinase